MLTAYVRAPSAPLAALGRPLAELPRAPVPLWIDLYQPTLSEERAIEALLQIDVPTAIDRRALEDSARFYVEDGALFLTSSVLGQRSDGPFSSEPVTFILTGTTLVTVRSNNPRAFQVGTERASARVASATTPAEVFAGLVEGVVERLADLLQECGADMSALSGRIFTADPTMPGAREERASLKSIGRIGGLLAMALQALSGLERMVAYCGTAAPQFGIDPGRLALIERDVAHLERLSEALQGKCSFLLDALLGMAAAGQNASLRALSVATVLFVPPTLIASVFGMNFDAMTWFLAPWGPPVAFALMAIAPALLFTFARWRRWF